MKDHVYLMTYLDEQLVTSAKKKVPDKLTKKFLFAVLYDESVDRVGVFSDLEELKNYLAVQRRITEYGGDLSSFASFFGEDWTPISEKSDDLLPRIAQAKHPDAGQWDLTREDYELLLVAEENPPTLIPYLVVDADDFKGKIIHKLTDGNIGDALTKALHLLFVLRDLSQLVDARGWIVHKGHNMSVLPYAAKRVAKEEAGTTKNEQAGIVSTELKP